MKDKSLKDIKLSTQNTLKCYDCQFWRGTCPKNKRNNKIAKDPKCEDFKPKETTASIPKYAISKNAPMRHTTRSNYQTHRENSLEPNMPYLGIEEVES
jgi:hypothetical protein